MIAKGISAGCTVIAGLLLASCGRVNEPAPQAPVQQQSESITPSERRAKLRVHFAGRAIEPTMIVVPSGTFVMGCRKDQDCRHDEKPAVTIELPGFELARTEVTFDEWDACFADGGCDRFPADSGWGRSLIPVINVSWNDAQQYIDWLNRKTGGRYRLPTEAEFEYALRGTASSRFWTGDCIDGTQANFDAESPAEDCPKSPNLLLRPAVVASYAPNSHGLHDLAGNVAEWVSDCWHYTHKDMKRDGRRIGTGNCSHRVVRGGSWYDRGDFLRSASRDWFEIDDKVDTVGFRLARSR